MPNVKVQPTAEAAGEPADVAEVPATSDDPASKRNWYVVKVQSGREETIKAAVERKVKIEGLEEFFGQIAVPVEQNSSISETATAITPDGPRTG